jgi:hypothetical protein
MPGVDDDEIRALLVRLGRPHPSGGRVIERAAILAEGADFDVVMKWITAHRGTAEIVAAAAPRGGLHGTRLNDGGGVGSDDRPPARFVLPADALAPPAAS